MSELTYGTVRGHFGDTVLDPDVPIRGTVTLTPEYEWLLSPNSTPPTVILPTPTTITLDGNSFEESVVATDDGSVNPVDWTYRVSFEIFMGETLWIKQPVSLKVPAGKVTDLSMALPVAGSPGNAVTKGDTGDTGPSNVLSIGTVTEGPAAATLTGESPAQVLNLAIPKGAKGDTGDEGPSTVLSIGTVTEGPAAATLTGESPTQVLNLAIPKGAKGDTGGLTDLTMGAVTGLAAGSAPTATISGAAPNKSLALGIPKGDKGDPGGWVATNLTTENLNTVITPGLYRQAGGNGTIANNYPFTGFTGAIEVLQTHSFSFTQRATPRFNSGTQRTVYIRHLVDNGTWNPWYALNASRTDQTAGRAIYQWDELNNREQLIYGDTGWRDVTTDIANGWQVTSAKIRREGARVSVMLTRLTGASATASQMYYVPSGFRLSGNSNAFLSNPVATSDTTAGNIAVGGVNGTMQAITSLTVGDRIVSVNWTTVDPWPTTLPGTAVGTIPNL